MPSFYKGTIPIINDDPSTMDIAHPPGASYGYVERDYKLYPKEMMAAPTDMKIIDPSEWDAWYDEQEAEKSSLEHLFLNGPNGGPAFVNLDQNGHGYCWAYSNGQCVMMKRLSNNMPMVRLNPHAVAAIIKKGRDEGGWCGLGAKFVREVGIPSEDHWPVHSRDLRNDTPAMRANAALHKTLEDYVDLTRDVYDQNLTVNQLATCLFNNDPCAVDFNWQSHSVCGIRWVRIERGSWGILILNSWKGWGRFGLGVYQGSKAIPDGAVCLRSTSASTV